MDDLPLFDEEEAEVFTEKVKQKRNAKEKRVLGGGSHFDYKPPPPDLPLSEREALWGFTLDELKAATKVVNILVKNPHLYVGDPLLSESRLYTMLSRDRNIKVENRATYAKVMKEERRGRERQERKEDLAKIQRTGMKKERDMALQQLLLTTNPNDKDDCPTISVVNEAEATSPQPEMNRWQACHICKCRYTVLHHYYYALCPTCGDLNFQKRTQTRDMTGKTVLLTGCRIKIGYAMALSLLRCGAQLVGTTRFVHECLHRFMMEDDYSIWKDRLHLFSLDMRDLWMVTRFTDFLLRSFPKIFLIMNNAAQTIQRTSEYTAAQRRTEAAPPLAVQQEVQTQPLMTEWLHFFGQHSSVRIGESLQLDYHPTAQSNAAPKPKDGSSILAPPMAPDRYDTYAESLDVRIKNSWTAKLAEVEGSEAAEVMAINALAPFILNSKLKPALIAAGGGFIINVSAMEGMFYRHKLTTHPQTNMAKAALNMMTRTSAADYAESGIYMNSVDTGWITDESPIQKRNARLENNMLCPLDEIDAAARCLDLVYTDSKEFGKFWKDYREIPW